MGGGRLRFPMFAIRIKSIPAMCSRISTSSSSYVLIVGALFLIIVEINQTDCNSILPKVGSATGAGAPEGLLNNDDVSMSTSGTRSGEDSSSSGGSKSSSNGSERTGSVYDETTSSYSGSTSSPSPISNSSSSSPSPASSSASSNQNASTLNGFEGQIPLERLPSNTLLKYTAYKDVSILHFRIPTDTRTAFFSFKAYEESKSAFRKYSFSAEIVVKSNSINFCFD